MEETRDVIPLEQESLTPVSVPHRRKNISTKKSEQKIEQLKKAWAAVKDGTMTMYKAANHYQVALSTLWDWCQRPDIIDKTPVVGRPCFLGSALEDRLKEWIFEAARTGICQEYCLHFSNNKLILYFFIEVFQSIRHSCNSKPNDIMNSMKWLMVGCLVPSG